MDLQIEYFIFQTSGLLPNDVILMSPKFKDMLLQNDETALILNSYRIILTNDVETFLITSIVQRPSASVAWKRLYKYLQAAVHTVFKDVPTEPYSLIGFNEGSEVSRVYGIINKLVEVKRETYASNAAYNEAALQMIEELRLDYPIAASKLKVVYDAHKFSDLLAIKKDGNTVSLVNQIDKTLVSHELN